MLAYYILALASCIHVQINVIALNTVCAPAGEYKLTDEVGMAFIKLIWSTLIDQIYQPLYKRIILMTPHYLLEASGAPAFTLQQGEAVLSQIVAKCGLHNSVKLSQCGWPELDLSFVATSWGIEWTWPRFSWNTRWKAGHLLTGAAEQVRQTRRPPDESFDWDSIADPLLAGEKSAYRLHRSMPARTSRSGRKRELGRTENE